MGSLTHLPRRQLAASLPLPIRGTPWADAEPGQAISRCQPTNEGSIQMSGNTCLSSQPQSQRRRVRHEVRDSILVTVVTLVMSAVVAVLLVGLSAMARLVG